MRSAREQGGIVRLAALVLVGLNGKVISAERLVLVAAPDHRLGSLRLAPVSQLRDSRWSPSHGALRSARIQRTHAMRPGSEHASPSRPATSTCSATSSHAVWASPSFPDPSPKPPRRAIPCTSSASGLPSPSGTRSSCGTRTAGTPPRSRRFSRTPEPGQSRGPLSLRSLHRAARQSGSQEPRQAVDCLGDVVAAGAEADAEVARHAEAVPRCQQHAVGRRLFAEGAARLTRA
jgi:hypothetical protein